MKKEKMLHHQTVTKNNADIHGHHLTIYGSNNNISGHHNTIHGHNNNVDGHHHNVNGHNNNVNGHHNNVNGHNNNVDGHHTIVNGHNTDIVCSNGSIGLVTGNSSTTINNSFSDDYTDSVIGGVVADMISCATMSNGDKIKIRNKKVYVNGKLFKTMSSSRMSSISVTTDTVIIDGKIIYPEN